MAYREYQRVTSLRLHPEMPARNVEERILRRAFDAVCASAGLAILAPLFAMIALAIKVDDGGPILYFSMPRRQGTSEISPPQIQEHALQLRGRLFANAPRDARVTRVGRFLRRYKLDELPQLVNVLKGEMQLVGVRPQVEKFVNIFPAQYGELLQTPPGITDLATLSFRDEERVFHEEFHRGATILQNPAH